MSASVAAAEESLRVGEFELAESRFRDGLMHGWMLIGNLRGADGNIDEAKDAFTRASMVTANPRLGIQALAQTQLHAGDPTAAVALLTKLLNADQRDITTRRLLAQALVAMGETAEAVQELETAHTIAPDDPELAFALASGYLQVKKLEAADRLFVRVLESRPMAETHVLIGRTYRDAKQYDRARTAFRAALAMNPRVRRAHYYLGTVALQEEGISRLDEAIDEFERELRTYPDDPITTLRLGIALALSQRNQEALPLLERAAQSPSAPAEAFLYLGRTRLALDRPADAVVALQRALELWGSRTPEAGTNNAGATHYQLAIAYRKLGDQENAARHFRDAESASTRRTEAVRDDLTRYLADAPPDPQKSGRPPREAVFHLTTASPEDRAALLKAVSTALARAYFNLGVIKAQQQHFARAADQFEQAVELDPSFPRGHYSLGVAYFNAGKHERAASVLARAIESSPDDLDARRMLALSLLNAGSYAEAAELLRNDPRRETDPSLEYAFGLALVRSGRAEDAEVVFSQLLTHHGDSPEINVVQGQAHAQQGDFDEAIKSLTHALALKPDVRDANGALGVIYLKQGKLDEAVKALRAELAVNPGDLPSRQALATVLDLQGQRAQAMTELRAVLRAKPDYADARYLLGKVLLAEGQAAEAAEHLDAAARLAPEDANIHYQLGQAYQKLGRPDLAQRQFEIFRQLKDKRAGRTQ